MKALLPICSAVLLSLSSPIVHAYGSGTAAGGCHKPTFSEFQPATNKYTQSFREFSLVTSSNVAPSSIEVSVSIGEAKFHFTAKELSISQRKNGQYEVKGKLDRNIEHGFARISVSAHTQGHATCHHSDGYLVRIQ